MLIHHCDGTRSCTNFTHKFTHTFANYAPRFLIKHCWIIVKTPCFPRVHTKNSMLHFFINHLCIQLLNLLILQSRECNFLLVPQSQVIGHDEQILIEFVYQLSKLHVLLYPLLLIILEHDDVISTPSTHHFDVIISCITFPIN